MAIIKDFTELIGLLDGRLTLLREAIMDMDVKPGSIATTWLGKWATYIRGEKTFSSNNLKSYAHREIIRVHFGYRAKSELGGEHYAVVMDVGNNPNNPTLTVVPLSSLKPEKKVHFNNVDLGNKLITDINPHTGENLAKSGTSEAVIQQLTCIGKQRIVRPLNTGDPVLGFVPPEKMREIDKNCK